MSSAFTPGDSHVIAERLAKFRVLQGVSPKAIRLIARAGYWFCLPGGAELHRQGPTERALFFVLSGTMSVHVDDGTGLLECVAHVATGETLGEMSLLTDEPTSARLFAHRDTEIFVLDRKAFERVTNEHPEFLRNISVLLIERLRRTTQRVAIRHAGRSVALRAAHEGVDLAGLASRLLTALWSIGVKATCLDASDAGRPMDFYHGIEAAHDIVLQLVMPGDGPWRRQAERQVDRVFEVDEAAPGHDERRPTSDEGRAPIGKVLVADRLPQGPAHTDGPISHLVRPGRREDVLRFARFLSGRAVGVVLSGGGARGFAHLGVLRALRAAGVSIDAVGGASMGAIIGAGVAAEWDEDEMQRRMRASFVATNPMSDITVPTISFFGGRKVRRLLSENFGAQRIETLPVPYFCVTSDLTTGRDAMHRAGDLVQRLQASVALPGLLPPVVIDGRVHVDGGIMNNLPVDHMSRLGVGASIAVDVSGDTSLQPRDGVASPGILSILVRTGTVGNEWQRREARRQANLVLDPPVDNVGFTEWAAFDRMVEAGYRDTMRRFEADPRLIERVTRRFAA